MKPLITLLSTAAVFVSLGLVAPAFSEATKQAVVLTEVDPVVLVTGWRASDIIGAKVYDVAGGDIGKLEDVIITTGGLVPYAVVSVGGLLGMEAHRGVVEASSLELINKKLMLRGASKASLMALPDYEFAS